MASVQSTTDASLGRSTFSDGLVVVHDPASRDTEYVHQEIFEKRVYLQHGVALHDDATLVDVGGHIGLFSLFALKNYARVKVFVLEPMPRTFRALSLNLEGNKPEGSAVRLLNHGASDKPRTATFNYYPEIPGHSTMFPEHKAEVHRITEAQLLADPWAHNKLLGILCFLLFPFRRQVVRAATKWLFRAEQVTCQLRPLSDVIEEENIERIDLLKVDVEDAELDVLKGIRAEHWPRIRQVVIETSDEGDRREKVEQLLKAQGFRYVTERDPVAPELAAHIIFAVREGAGSTGPNAA